ncbi:MAG: serine/threonine protein kinase, partial [Saprospiraceae bacterium]
MKKVFFKRDNIELFLDNEPFASGGEGNLYKIRKPAKYTKFVVKLYHQDKRTAARQRKVEYMITNPPIDYTQQGHYPLIWPLGLVAERSGFAGFMMPFAKGEKLEILCMPRIHRNLKTRWGRFDFSRPESMQMRLKICYNIATAVHQVHATDHYVLVDLKTDNIIIQPNGFVAIVDMDSVEIIDEGRVLFPATVTTPEYTPAEYYTKNVQPGKMPIFESWDLFSLTVIFYKLLFGIHPFAASCNPPYDKLVSLHQKIEAGL